MISLKEYTVLIRGAGEIASAVGLTLHRVGFKVIMTELEIPLSIRRTVCFSEAITNETTNVEEVIAKKSNIENYQDVLKSNKIPILADSLKIFDIVRPDIYIDGRMMKSIVNDRRSELYFIIGLGPGFIVNQNCDAIVETMRGHNLGRVLWIGKAQKNTGIPGKIGGESAKRVIHSDKDGKLDWFVDFGDIVEENQVIGKISNLDIKTKISGIVRGLISPSVKIKKGMKIADVDPRGVEVDYTTISDKARNIGRGVLEAILVHLSG